MYPIEYVTLMLFYSAICIFLVFSLKTYNAGLVKEKYNMDLFLNDNGEYVKNCDTEQVYCIDNCTFLCLKGDNYHCVNNVCVLNSKNDDKNDCQMGIKVLTIEGKSGVQQWKCLCTHPTIFTGEFCDQTVIDICEQGIFLFGDQNKCICNPPYVLFWDAKNRPHCLEKHYKSFFDDQYRSQ